MVQYEKLDNYMEGRRRYTSLQDPAELEQYLIGGTKMMKRNSIEGTPANFTSEHPSLLDAHNKFGPKKAAMPFEVSASVKVYDVL